jgi:hypothetical protein
MGVLDRWVNTGGSGVFFVGGEKACDLRGVMLSVTEEEKSDFVGRRPGMLGADVGAWVGACLWC